MAKDLRYYLKFDSNGRKLMADLGVSAQQLDKALEGVGKSSTAVKTNMLQMASVTVVIDGVQSAVSGLYNSMKDLSDAYTVQIEAETKLATVMRERMGATDSSIQSIKDLASAQQELGIIGDEVQLAGAQQLATFLSSTDTLATLIPAMNDLVAQQKGYAATGTDAVNIANLFGKAMQGNASALRRVGITFSEAQAEALKTGDEFERASLLADIVTQNVGHMNQALANTPSGQIKQLENTLGDVKESIGSWTQSALPFVTMANGTVLAISNIGKLCTGIKAATVAVKGLAIGEKVAHAARVVHVVTVRALSQAFQALGMSARVASTAIAGIGVAGIAIAGITALASAMSNLSDKTDKAVKSLHKFPKTVDFADENHKLRYEFKIEEVDNIDEEIKRLKNVGKEANQTIARFNAGAERGEFSHSVTRDSDKRKRKSEYQIAYQEAQEAQSAAEAAKKRIAELEKERERRQIAMAAEEAALKPNNFDANKKPAYDTSGDAALYTTLGQYTQKLKELNDARANASGQEIVNIDRQIERVKTLQSQFERGRGVGFEVENIDYDLRGKAPKIELPVIVAPQIEKIDLSNISDALNDIGDTAEKAGKSIKDSLFSGWSGVKSTVSSFESMRKAVEGNGTAWERFVGIIDGAIGIFQGVTAAMELVNAISPLFQANRQQEAIATNAETTAEVANAAAKTFSAHAWLPWVGVGVAAAAVAMMVASMAGLPKFANGGVAYGPTLGLFGEYPGASNNPEVVAPLSELKKYIGTDGDVISGDVTFRISGPDLVGVLKRRTTFTHRM